MWARLRGIANWSEVCWTMLALFLLFVAANLTLLAVALSEGPIDEVAIVLDRAMQVGLALIGTPVIVKQLRELGVYRDWPPMLLVAGAVFIALLVLVEVVLWYGAAAAVLLTVLVVSALARRRQRAHDEDFGGRA